MDVFLGEKERIDDLGRRGYRIIQNPDRFCFGVDAALLAWFSEIKSGEKALDLCTGTGIVPLLMDARNACGDYTGLEILPDMAEMASRSVKLNDCADHMRILNGDLREASRLFGRGVFDVVTCNPPYMRKKDGLVNPDISLAVARHEILCTLSEVVLEASAVLKPGGRFYMVHRPERLPEIFAEMAAAKLKPLKMVFVHPMIDRDATMVLVSAVKGGRNHLSVLPPVVIYEKKGVYTAKIKEIYDDGHGRG